ncbi:MAG TPA: UvrD-helicase domain-containing protein, partial [Candidatus Krumholzibacteria bacterium]
MPEFTWTPEQVAAITAAKNTLLVANAGTGKTTTVIGKVLWQLGLDTGSTRRNGEPIPACPDPCELSEIAAITFTEKGAYDLKKKLREAIEASERGEELRWHIDAAYIGTIHGFCGALLRENALRFGIEPTFRVLDENEAIAEQERLVRDVVLQSLEAGEEPTDELLQDMKLRGYQRASGVIDYVRKAMRDLRWHGQRYESWTRDLRWQGQRYESWMRDGCLDIEHLENIAPAFDDLDKPLLLRCDALCRLAAVAL